MCQQLLNVLGVAFAAAILVSRPSAADHALQGAVRNPPNQGSGYDTATAEQLFQGDLGPELGIGCSNAAGTSGGPNDVAVGVTAALSPPLIVTSHFYHLFTQVSPNITSLTFSLWGGGPQPGALIGQLTGLPFTQGSHTVVFPTAPLIHSPQFFFGHTQPQTNVGMRWGLDTSSGSAGTSYIRAPSCGASTFMLVDSLGFPGNWVMSVSVEVVLPVELTSWGDVKATYR